MRNSWALIAGVVVGSLGMAGGLAAAGAEAPGGLYRDAAAPLEVRVSDLLSKLTLDEKISLVHADSKFTTAALTRFGAARRWMSDGPQGVREDIGPDTWKPAGRTDDFATAMPANIGLAASFDPEMASAYGNVIGEEAFARGKQTMLGPGVNILRTPLNGRNSEYLGEDPYLAGRMAVAYIRAVQSHGVTSCVKHFAANNQETERNKVDVEMDDRTLHEIYLPAFKAAVTEGHVWCVMTAYNKFLGTYCSENELLINQILKGDWGFPGVVMSDWSGTHSTVNAANHGLDLEMGTDRAYADFYFADALKSAVEKKEVLGERLDDMVRRNLRVMFVAGMFDAEGGGASGKPKVALMSAEHVAAARAVEEAGMVLLKNDGGMLPLDVAKVKKIAVIGEIATEKFAHGGNSAAIKTKNEVTPLEGIQKFVGEGMQVVYAAGYSAPAQGKETVDAAKEAALVKEAVEAATGADAVIVVAGLYRSQDEEGVDRADMKMAAGQLNVIDAVAAANSRTVVVLTGGGPLEMPWISKVPAILQYWYGGMEGGDALADVLFGKVSPSGKLPCTFPKVLADSPAHQGGAVHYPGEGLKEVYAEGILVGYRWFDTKNVEPLFPFGYGLSYTTFACSDLAVVPGEKGNLTVQVTVGNTGHREGAEVVQVYVKDGHASVERPAHELKGFAKVKLAAGEKRRVSIPLGTSSLEYYDPKRAAWVAEAGEFEIQVGTSSRDLPLHGTYTLAETIVEKHR